MVVEAEKKRIVSAEAAAAAGNMAAAVTVAEGAEMGAAVAGMLGSEHSGSGEFPVPAALAALEEGEVEVGPDNYYLSRHRLNLKT